MMAIKKVHFRGILESRGGLTAEAEIHLSDGSVGVASAPRAIAPGRRERRRSCIDAFGALDSQGSFANLRWNIEGRDFESQAHFDSFVETIPSAMELGADVRLVLSVAFCRASASSAGLPLLLWLNRLSRRRAAVPKLLVNIFSGGIHDASRSMPFQQIMFVPDFGDLHKNIEAALACYGVVETRLEKQTGCLCYSPSSGIQVRGAGYIELLHELTAVMNELGYLRSKAFLGIDVAAEHLRTVDGRYCFGKEIINGKELSERLMELARAYNVQFIEDPFDADDRELWIEFTRELHPQTIVFGDDLFASDSANIKPGLASGLLLKPNQIGSVTRALDASQTAHQHGLQLAVSHRSGETEDTIMCDLAVALGSNYIKLGGPRRGDRVAKYNQLLRLSEQMQDM